MALFELSRGASGIAAAVWAAIPEEEWSDPQMPWWVSGADEEWWLEITGLIPAPDTLAAVVLELCEMVNRHRKGATLPCECGDGIEGVRVWGDGDSYFDGERTHPECRGTGVQQCENCGEEDAAMAAPLGFFCFRCAAKDYPLLAFRAGKDGVGPGASAPSTEAEDAPQMQKRVVG